MNRKIFYDTIRPHVNLTTQNVIGMEKLLDYAEKHFTSTIQRLAYIIATAWWESAQTMHPVKEAYWKDEAWRKKNLRYYPWYGRGLVQTTWEDNYRQIAIAMGLPSDTFIKNPDYLLLFEYALPALFVGMEKGVYTSKDIDDYIDELDESDAEDLREFTNARRIVNAMDKASTIGKLALTFEKGLKAAGFTSKKGVAPVVPDVPVPPPVVTPTPAPVPPIDYEPPPEPEYKPEPADEKPFPYTIVAAAVVIGMAVLYYIFGA